MARETVNRLINRVHDEALADAATRAHGVMLDVGCGRKPHRAAFAPYVSAHVGLDHEEATHGLEDVDIVASAYEIPVPDSTYDTVLCTCVLEHLEEPARALADAHRVLVDGGLAIYTVPFIWHLHEEPRDFYRFTRHGLVHLFAQAGFEIDEIRSIGGFWVAFGQEFAYYVYRLNRGPLRRARVVPAIAIAIQRIASMLDRVDRGEMWPSHYLVIAHAIKERPKPGSS
jgi:SAM-dependent methyltransferase